MFIYNEKENIFHIQLKDLLHINEVDENIEPELQQLIMTFFMSYTGLPDELNSFITFKKDFIEYLRSFNYLIDYKKEKYLSNKDLLKKISTYMILSLNNPGNKEYGFNLASYKYLYDYKNAKIKISFPDEEFFDGKYGTYITIDNKYKIIESYDYATWFVARVDDAIITDDELYKIRPYIETYINSNVLSKPYTGFYTTYNSDDEKTVMYLFEHVKFCEDKPEVRQRKDNNENI